MNAKNPHDPTHRCHEPYRHHDLVRMSAGPIGPR